MKISVKTSAIIALFGVVMVAGCGGGGGGAQPNSTTAVVDTPAPPASAPPVGSVTGQVISYGTGQAISDAKVSSGGVTVSTGADGRYEIKGINAADRVVINVNATSFAQGMSVASVPANGTSTVVTKLLPIGIETTINNATGGDVVDASGAKVSLPANAFTGGAGNVTVALTAVNPVLDSSVMPGDYTTNGGAQSIESFGAIIVTPRDASGNLVNLASGKTATIRIPATSRSGTFDPTIPLLSLNPATGSWVQEGTATLAGVAPNQYYEGVVTHFSSWNADRAIETVRVSGCVNDVNGNPVTNVLVRSDGIDYSGTASTYSGVSGTFTVAMKKLAKATISGSLGNGFLTNFLTATSGSGDVTLPACLVLTEARNAVNIKLSWGAAPADVDSYLLTPSGSKIYYGSRGSLQVAPFANLDVDDTSSFGPEVVTINRLMVGAYTYGVDNFSRTYTPGLTNSPIRVELNVGNSQRIFSATTGETTGTRFLRMFRLNVDASCNVTVEVVNTWENSTPSAPVATTPIYCVAP
jgi:hypothetical protein